jgi:archaellum component FlaC
MTAIPGRRAADKGREAVVIELQVRMERILAELNKLEEINEGTLRTRGMKERIVLAEEEIKRNKEAWEKVVKQLSEIESRMSTTLREAFVELKTSFTNELAKLSTETQTQKNILTKMQPYVNVISWVVTAGAGIILSLVLTGQWTIGPRP